MGCCSSKEDTKFNINFTPTNNRSSKVEGVKSSFNDKETLDKTQDNYINNKVKSSSLIGNNKIQESDGEESSVQYENILTVNNIPGDPNSQNTNTTNIRTKMLKSKTEAMLNFKLNFNKTQRVESSKGMGMVPSNSQPVFQVMSNQNAFNTEELNMNMDMINNVYHGNGRNKESDIINCMNKQSVLTGEFMSNKESFMKENSNYGTDNFSSLIDKDNVFPTNSHHFNVDNKEFNFNHYDNILPMPISPNQSAVDLSIFNTISSNKKFNVSMNKTSSNGHKSSNNKKINKIAQFKLQEDEEKRTAFNTIRDDDRKTTQFSLKDIKKEFETISHTGELKKKKRPPVRSEKKVQSMKKINKTDILSSKSISYNHQYSTNIKPIDILSFNSNKDKDKDNNNKPPVATTNKLSKLSLSKYVHVFTDVGNTGVSAQNSTHKHNKRVSMEVDGDITNFRYRIGTNSNNSFANHNNVSINNYSVRQHSSNNSILRDISSKKYEINSARVFD